MSDGKRGSKPLGRREWIGGCAPRGALLQAVLVSPAPPAGWTKADLARAAGVTTKGGVDDHVAGLAALGLLQDGPDGRWRPGESRRLAAALRRVLSEIDEVLPALDRIPS